MTGDIDDANSFLAFTLNYFSIFFTFISFYIGPALLAFSIMCAAYSLRTWRRNGIACDELIFLPGTKHGLKHGANSTLEHFQKRLSSNAYAEVKNNDGGENAEGEDENDKEGVEMTPMLSKSASDHESKNEDISDVENGICRRNIYENKAPKEVNEVNEGHEEEDRNDENEETSVIDMALQNLESWEVEGDGNYAYAPSATSVFGGGLDLMTPVLFNFHLFTEAIAHQSYEKGELSPKILPLIFLTILFFRAVIPFQRRRRFWGTLKYILVAPFHYVSFRDDFTADILTSFVRPLQDFVFAIFYYIAVIRGLVGNHYKLEDLDQLLEKNWVLHNALLPACAILPLWFKFMQCLRLVYDTKQRWPHLGNAFKYFSASLIILYAMAHQQTHKGHWWISFFILATLYQVWWDTIIDWELFVFDTPEDLRELFSSEEDVVLNSSRSREALPSPYKYLTPFQRKYMILKTKIKAFLKRIKLRKRRLFKKDQFYWRLFWINASLRCLWMLQFIPSHHVSPEGDLLYTFSSDVHNYVGVIISGAEIIRRCLWCIVRVEIETIKITDPTYYEDLDAKDSNGSMKVTPVKSRANDSSPSDVNELYPKLSSGVASKLEFFELFSYGVMFVGLGYFIIITK